MIVKLRLGIITSYLYTGIPDCGDAGFVTVKRAVGTYNYTADSQDGTKHWSGTFTIKSNECNTMKLYVAKDNKTESSDNPRYNSEKKEVRNLKAW